MLRILATGLVVALGLVLATAQTSLQITVSNVAQEPLEGATITSLPKQQFFITNALGQAKIAPSDSLFVSYLGLESQLLSWETAVALKGNIVLGGGGLALPEVIVGATSNRRDLSQEQLRLSALDLQRVQATTPAAALSATAGAFVQMSQLGGGSPILRGFEANRVLLIIDGIRMNNAIYRSGHLQNAITVDENALSSLEVSYGPGALAYGSDAIGGLIHFKTKNPLPHGQEKARWSGAAAIRWGSAAQEQTLTTELTYHARKWSSYTAITGSRFGDLKAGNRRPTAYPDFGTRSYYVERINGEDLIQDNDDPDRQIGSGYDQVDLIQKVNWQASKGLLLQLNLQYSSSTDVPRYDRLTETRNGLPRFAEWYYGPQSRGLAALGAVWKKKTFWADEIRLMLSHQLIAEDRFDRPFMSPWREESLVQVDLTALTLDGNKHVGLRGRLQYGLEARTEWVMASAARRSLENGGVLLDVNSRYPSQESGLDAYSAFVQYRQHSKDSSLLWEGGLRWTRRELSARFGANDPIAWPSPYLEGIRNITDALNAAIGLRWKMGRWQWRTHLASGFRAPNIDDFAKFRENNGFVQIPNPDLEPERSVSTDLSLRYQHRRNSHLQLTIYRTWLNNAMVRENFQLPDGTTSFISRGDTLFVQAVVNAERARVWGISGSWRQTLHAKWTINGQIHYTYGRRDFQLSPNEVVEVPLDHIPPLYGQLQLDYRNDRWEAGLQWQFQAQKKLSEYAVSGISKQGSQLLFDRGGTSDNLDLTPVDNTTGQFTGSYAWSIWSINIAYRLSSGLRVRLRVENLLDIHYRPFASGISAPGRNFVMGVYSWF